MSEEGLKAGLDYRTPFPYRVVNSEKSDEELDTDTKKMEFTWIHPVRSVRDILKRQQKKYFIHPGTKPEEVFKIFWLKGPPQYQWPTDCMVMVHWRCHLRFCLVSFNFCNKVFACHDHLGRPTVAVNPSKCMKPQCNTTNRTLDATYNLLAQCLFNPWLQMSSRRPKTLHLYRTWSLS